MAYGRFMQQSHTDTLRLTGDVAFTGTISQFESVSLAEAADLTIAAAELGDNTITTVTGTTGGVVETVTFTGTADADTITLATITSVTDARLVVNADGGNDAVTGSNFGDLINGGAGNDTISGGAGADVINIGLSTTDIDTVKYVGATDTLTGTVTDGSTGNVLGADVILSIQEGDKIDLSSLDNLDFADGSVSSGTTYHTGTANAVVLVQGSYDTANGTFTAGLAGNDYLFQYTGGSTTTTINNVVIQDFGTGGLTLSFSGEVGDIVSGTDANPGNPVPISAVLNNQTNQLVVTYSEPMKAGSATDESKLGWDFDYSTEADATGDVMFTSSSFNAATVDGNTVSYQFTGSSLPANIVGDVNFNDGDEDALDFSAGFERDLLNNPSVEALNTPVQYNWLMDTTTGTFYGGSRSDTITGSTGNDIIQGGAGADSLVGGNGDDTFVIAGTADIAAGEVINGTSGTDTISVTATTDFTGASISNIDTISLASGVTATFTGAQITGQTWAVNGVASGATEALVVTAAANANVTLANVTATNATVTLNGSTGAEILTGTAGADTFTGGAGADQITTGLGADVLHLAASGDSAVATIGGTQIQNITEAAGDVVTGDISDTFILAGGTGTGTYNSFGSALPVSFFGSTYNIWDLASSGLDVFVYQDGTKFYLAYETTDGGENGLGTLETVELVGIVSANDEFSVSVEGVVSFTVV